MPGSQWSVNITDNGNVDIMPQNFESKSLTPQSNRKSNYSYSEDHDHSIAAEKPTMRVGRDNSTKFFLDFFT